MKLTGLASQGLTLLAVGAMAVLIIMNPNAFVPEASTVWKGLSSETRLLSGSGYQASGKYNK